MSLTDITINGADKRAIDRLQSFMPDQIFDAHAHLYDCAFAPAEAAPGSIFEACGQVITMDDYIRLQGRLYGESKKIWLNIITLPDATMADLTNGHRGASTDFLKKQLEQHPYCVGEVFILATDTISDIEAQLVHPNIRGFKCYHTSAERKPTWHAGIGEYLPESAWEVANDRGFCITLHMVKDLALADPDNLTYVSGAFAGGNYRLCFLIWNT